MKQFISENLVQLRGTIADACEEYDRDADDITIVAVTKTHPASAIQKAVAAGIHNIGESRLQESAPKIEEVGRIARFHMIGHLQSNKVKRAVELFDVIQSVDSLKLAEEINKRAGEAERVIDCLIEVNCSREAQKYGVTPEETPGLIKQVNAMQNIDLLGLMTIGPLTDDEDEIRRVFRTCAELFKAGQDIAGDDFEELSMGMSNDYCLAIAEGSTMIRVGTGIFGPRESATA